MKASDLMILCLTTYSVVALKMADEPCDRSGQTHEKLFEAYWAQLGKPPNPNFFDVVEYVGASDAASRLVSQQYYTDNLGDEMPCVDNLGFFEEKIQLPDVAGNFEAGREECPMKLTSTYGQNMYKFMVTDGLQHNELNGTQVLEVSSGRGKGAAYVAQTFGPAKYTGVDLNEARVKTASKLWGGTPNLKFEVGSASQLPIQNSSMDFVINVESSMHYPDFEKFLSEVYRVLKPGGKFLWTAPIMFRGDTAANKENQFTASGFHLEKNMDITRNVTQARRNALQKTGAQEFEITCKFLNDFFFWNFLCLPGSVAFKGLDTGLTPYLRFIAKKPL